MIELIPKLIIRRKVALPKSGAVRRKKKSGDLVLLQMVQDGGNYQLMEVSS